MNKTSEYQFLRDNAHNSMGTGLNLKCFLNKTKDWALVQNAALVGVGFSLG